MTINNGSFSGATNYLLTWEPGVADHITCNSKEGLLAAQVRWLKNQVEKVLPTPFLPTHFKAFGKNCWKF